MPLPEFQPNGLLPEGVHPATEDELKARCVAPFATSRTRPNLFEGFQRYRQELDSLYLDVTQWVDGSFVDQTRLDPDDIDIVNFVDSSGLQNIPVDDQPKASQLLSGGETTKAEYHCHTYLVIAFPAEHPFAENFDERRRYWRKWWSRPQDYSSPPSKRPAPHRGPKGFVAMTVGSEAAAPRIQTDL